MSLNLAMGATKETLQDIKHYTAHIKSAKEVEESGIVLSLEENTQYLSPVLLSVQDERPLPK
jgi:hypothetical protein